MIGSSGSNMLTKSTSFGFNKSAYFFDQLRKAYICKQLFSIMLCAVF